MSSSLKSASDSTRTVGAGGVCVFASGTNDETVVPPGVVLPVSGLLASQNTTYAANWNNLMALAVLTSLPLLIVFIISQKRLISGLSLGAVK